jgi:hypothetical protein
MPTTDRPQPESVPDLLRMLESAFNRGCGPLDDEVKRLMDAARRFEGGAEAAHTLLRARFGDHAAGTPRLLFRLVRLVMTGVFFLFGLFVVSAVMAWKLWYPEPQAAVPVEVLVALDALRTPYRVTILDSASSPGDKPGPTTAVAGQKYVGRFSARVVDRTNVPLQGLEVVFTLDPNGTATTVRDEDAQTKNGKFVLNRRTNGGYRSNSLDREQAGEIGSVTVVVGQDVGKSFLIRATVTGYQDLPLHQDLTVQIVSPPPPGESATKRAASPSGVPAAKPENKAAEKATEKAAETTPEKAAP